MEENKVLKGRNEQLVEKQIATEEAIVGIGGAVDKPTFLELVIESIEGIVMGVVDLFDNEDSGSE